MRDKVVFFIGSAYAYELFAKNRRRQGLSMENHYLAQREEQVRGFRCKVEVVLGHDWAEYMNQDFLETLHSMKAVYLNDERDLKISVVDKRVVPPTEEEMAEVRESLARAAERLQ